MKETASEYNSKCLDSNNGHSISTDFIKLRGYHVVEIISLFV